MFEQVASPLTASTRRSVLGRAGAAGLGALAAAQLGTLAALAQSKESVADILNIAATAEALAVSLTGAVIAGARNYDSGRGLPPMLVRWVKGIQAEEQVHYEYLVRAGAKPLTLTFTVPHDLSDITRDSKALLTFVVAAEGIFIGAYIAAAVEFAALAQPALAEVAFQVAGVESEHRVLAHYGLGALPPNDLGFERAPFATVGEAAAKVRSLGLLGTPRPAVTLHYADFARSVDFAGIGGRTP